MSARVLAGALLALGAAGGAGAALPVHEAIVVPAAPGPGNRAYTLCVKQRAATSDACVWTLRVEEDAPGTLARREFGTLASDDGLRVAVVLRKRREGGGYLDELWRFHQQMNPDLAVPGMPPDRALVTRGRLIATGYPLAFSGNLALSRFVLADTRSLNAIDDHGNVLAPLHQAAAGGASLALVARAGALAGFAEYGAAGAMRRLVVTDLDALDADVYDTQALPADGERAWNLERGWVALTDFPGDDPAAAEARARAGTPTALRVIDLAHQRTLFETARPGIALHPAWTDADTLAWQVDEVRVQTHRFDARSDIRLVQGNVRLLGERMVFLPCRERIVLQVDEAASAGTIVAQLRRALAQGERTFVEAFGTRKGAGIALDALGQISGDANGCLLDPERALAEARGGSGANAWQFSIHADGASLAEAGQPALALPYGRLRWVEGRRTLALRTGALALDFNATPELCRDARTGTWYGYRVVLRLSSPGQPRRELRGCGNFLQQGGDETSRAVATR